MGKPQKPLLMSHLTNVKLTNFLKEGTRKEVYDLAKEQLVKVLELEYSTMG